VAAADAGAASAALLMEAQVYAKACHVQHLQDNETSAPTVMTSRLRSLLIIGNRLLVGGKFFLMPTPLTGQRYTVTFGAFAFCLAACVQLSNHLLVAGRWLHGGSGSHWTDVLFAGFA
jgi:hypothetical protein